MKKNTYYRAQKITAWEEYRYSINPVIPNPDDEGYKFFTENNSLEGNEICWMQKNQFRNETQLNGKLSFGIALEAIKKGKIARFSGWSYDCIAFKGDTIAKQIYSWDGEWTHSIEYVPTQKELTEAKWTVEEDSL